MSRDFDLTGLQKLVYDNLARKDPRLAKMYLGALKVLRGDDNDDKIAQAAHSIREISNVLTRKVELGIEEKDPTSKEDHKKKIIKMQDPQGVLPSHLLGPYDEWARLHKWFTSVSHHEDGMAPTEEEFRTKLEKFELIISYLLRPHFNVIGEIDQLLLKATIGEEELRELVILLARNSASYGYFFDKAGDNWLQPLIQNGFFTRPPSTFKRDNLIFYPFWPESRYLARVADKRPKEVADVIIKCAGNMLNSDVNTRVLEDFMTAAVRMPLDESRKIADLAIRKRWRERNIASILNSKTDELAVRFAEWGEIATCLDLLKNLLDVTIDPANTQPSFHDVLGVIGDYEYEQILEKTVPKVFDRYPVEIIQFITSLLSKAILLSNKSRQAEGDDDLSSAWRPAIEDSDQNWGFHDTKDLLLNTLRDLMEESGRRNPEALTKAVIMIRQEKYVVFKRLEIHAYRIFPDLFKDQIESVCIDRIGDYDVSHEYHMFIREQYPKLSPEAKEKIITIIDRGPDIEFYITRKTELDGEAPSQEKIDKYVRIWKSSAIEPILAYLPDDWKKKNTDIVELAGRRGFEGYHVYHEIGTGESEKPDLSDDMQVEDVVRFAKSYIPEGFFGGRDDPNARKFHDLVTKKPLEYSKLAKELKDANPTMSYELISGLVNALRSQAEIEWDPVLDLCDYLTDKTIVQNLVKDYEDLSKAIAEFHFEGFIRKRPRIPYQERKRVWRIIERLDSMNYDDSEWAKGYPESEKDAYSIAINATNGKIVHALIAYAIWCFENIIVQSGKGEFVGEARTRLESHVDLSKDSKVSTKATFGYFFPQLASLSKEWTAANVDNMFPAANSVLADAAWESYQYNNVWGHAFAMLFPEYRARINKAIQEDKGEKLSQHVQNLVDHIVISYIFDIPRGDDLFKEFKHKAPPLMLDQVVNYIWRIIGDVDKTKINMDKIRAIWTDSKFQARPALTDLFLRSPFDRAYSISALLNNLKAAKEKVDHSHRVVEELVGYVKEFPSETLECVELIVAADSKTWEIHFMKDYIRTILADIRSTKNTELIERNNKLINYLGTLGYTEFRDLLS